MKNKFVNVMTKILVILVIIAIAVFTFYIYSNAKEDTSQTNKVEKEIDYLDTKITSMINYLNGIKLENYKIVINKIQEEEAETGSSEQKNDSQSQEGEKGEKEEDQESSKQETKITKMEQELIVDNNNEINWEWIQSETEVFYSVWATIVLDLYDIGVEGQKIVGFSNTLDSVLISIKEKDKVKANENIAKLYSFIPEYVKNTDIEDVKKNSLIAKSHIINACSYIQKEDWGKVEDEVGKVEKKFVELINNIESNGEQGRYNINKTYILIEELKNSLSTKDAGIFYVKYKNLLEELNTLI